MRLSKSFFKTSNNTTVLELLKNFNFVQIEENDGDSREDIIANLKEAAKSLKLIKEGKLVGCPAEELFNEL